MNRITQLAFITLVFSGCSSGKLSELTEICICEVTEHYVTSTDELENRTKELSFINSPVFELGVSKSDFATSAAILFNRKTELDSGSILQVNLVEEVGTNNRTTSYEFELDEIDSATPPYLETLELINSFVKNIYENNIDVCQNHLAQEIEEERLSSILANVRNDLEEGYLNTKIVGYRKNNELTEIYGGVWTENETLDLFRMTLNDTEDGQKILSFEF
ncbi:MAG: hypothetical protein ABJ004_00290 [Cyclobacteriaceae bacterium]